METKLSQLKKAAALNDWRKAVAIAAKFPRLGEFRGPILDAHMAYTNPRFLSQVGKDVDSCIAAGREALVAAYGIE